MEPAAAGAVLEGALRGLPKKAELTIADAAAKAGLALRDAERGLHFLSTKYRGTLSATDQGELLFKFPWGFSLPLVKKPWFVRGVERVGNFVRGVGKFVVRAWVSIVMIGYAAVFVALALAWAFSGRSDDRGGGGFTALYVIVRVISEALFWTFHPFSPLAVQRQHRHQQRHQQHLRARGPRRTRTIMRFGQQIEVDDDDDDKGAEDDDEKIPFYERVNRFVFGPEPEKVDLHEMQRRLIAQIRVNAGRIGLLDVMKVTGLPREEADPLMAKLLLDYDGEVDVSDDGAITYRFAGLRKTAGSVDDRAPPPVWNERKKAPAITGNASGSNFLVAAVNGFNLLMSFIALNMNLTIDRVFHLIQQAQSKIPLPPLPYDGMPLVLGIIPLLFSALLFALPLWRLLRSGAKKKEADAENARRAVLQTVFEQMEQAAESGKADDQRGIREAALKRAWHKATGEAPDDKELIAAIVALGGDIDMDASSSESGGPAGGRALYRFRDLEAEVAELQKQREQASEQEKSAGAVVFRAE